MSDSIKRMNQHHRNRIDLCCEDIVRKIDMLRLWPKLLEYKIYNRDDVNIPRWKTSLTNVETVRDILLTIKTRGPDAFENLLRSLREIGYENLADQLEGCKIIYNNNLEMNINERIPNINHSNQEEELLNSESEDKFFCKIQESNMPLKIKVKKAETFLDDPTNSNIQKYVMRSKPRGLVLIISNINYLLGDNPRKSAKHDKANLIELFEQMGFATVSYDDLTGQELIQVVKEFSQREDLRKVDSCFVIISSHGRSGNESNTTDEETGENNKNMRIEECRNDDKNTYMKEIDKDDENTEIEGIDFHAPSYKKVFCTDIINCFTSNVCPHLAGKPKVFIFQFCRGSKEQPTVKAPRHEVDSRTFFAIPNYKPYGIRNYCDILVAYATLPGHVAYRDNITGSWFIQILCEVFMNYACRLHLLDLLTLVDSRLEILRTPYQKCQTLAVNSVGFNRHCYLNPGLFQDT